MPNIVAVLRQEISRLARKEGRSHTRGLQKASAQYRRDVAALKRDVAQLRAELARLKRGVAKAPVLASAMEATADGRQGKRFSAKGLRTQRARLDLSAGDYGKLVGVTGHTIYSWEHGSSRPRASQVARLVPLRGIGKREALARLAQLAKPAAKTAAKPGRKKAR